MRHEVLGVGSPIRDLLIKITPAYLQSLEGAPYGMELVSYTELKALIKKSGSIPTELSGGSSCNTIKGLNSFGHACAFTGKLGKDAAGKKVTTGLLKAGINPLVCYGKSPTAHVLSLITPDGRRTFRSYMGAALEMTGKDLNPEHFQNAQLVHIEGYTLLASGLTKQAMQYAKEAGALISFDLGSFEMVEAFHASLPELISEYVSILFCNQEEALALTGKGPEAACTMLSSLGTIAVVMIGKNGCYVGSGNNSFHSPAFPVDPVDTTGAGDLFASGFLHGVLAGKTLEESARYGAITGGQVVQVIGAEIPSSLWPEIRMLTSDS